MSAAELGNLYVLNSSIVKKVAIHSFPMALWMNATQHYVVVKTGAFVYRQKMQKREKEKGHNL